MFNVAVIRLKDLVKYFMLAIGVISIIIIGKRYFTKNNFENLNLGQKVSSNINKYVKEAVNMEVPVAQKINNEYTNKQQSTEDINSKTKNVNEKTESSKNNFFERLLGLELSAIGAEEEIIEKIDVSNNENTKNNNNGKNERK